MSLLTNILEMVNIQMVSVSVSLPLSLFLCFFCSFSQAPCPFPKPPNKCKIQCKLLLLLFLCSIEKTIVRLSGSCSHSHAIFTNHLNEIFFTIAGTNVIQSNPQMSSTNAIISQVTSTPISSSSQPQLVSQMRGIVSNYFVDKTPIPVQQFIQNSINKFLSKEKITNKTLLILLPSLENDLAHVLECEVL